VNLGDSLEGLNKLKYLDISNNQISNIVQYTNLILNLDTFIVEGNPLNKESQELIDHIIAQAAELEVDEEDENGEEEDQEENEEGLENEGAQEVEENND